MLCFYIILNEIFLEKLKFQAKSDKTEKFAYNFASVFAYYLSICSKTLVPQGKLNVSCAPMKFFNFLDISWFPEILTFKLFGNSKVPSSLDIKFDFTCGE